MTARAIGARLLGCIVTAWLLASLPGCDRSATSPTANTTARPFTTASLFANAVTATVAIVRGELDYGQSALWAQQLAALDGSPDDRYAVDSALIDRNWSALYSGPLEDTERALTQARQDQDAVQIAQLLVFRAWAYSYVTAIWGDAPFSAAARGDAGVPTPTYDRQSAIYDALLKDLSQSAQILATAKSGGFGTSDPIFAGDLAKWTHFANTLRARLGLEMSKADPTRSKAEVVAALTAGGMTSNDDDATIRWPGDGANDNPWSRVKSEIRLSKTIADTLLSLNDPRLPIYARAAALSGQYVGAPNGLTAQDGAAFGDVTSRIGTAISKKDGATPLLTFAEVCFIKAEAAERGWISGSPAQFYSDGIHASMQHWGVVAVDVDAYLAQSAVQYASGNAGLSQIAVQRWIALFTQGVDAWREWRRNAQPDLVAVPTAQTPSHAIPRRVPYPGSELLRNSANVQAAISVQGGVSLTDRMWIDK